MAPKPGSIVGSIVAGLVVLGGAAFVVVQQGQVVASASEEKLTASDFRQHYGAYLRRTGVSDTPSLRRQFAMDLMLSRLLIAHALEGGVSDQPAFLAREERLRRALLVDAYVYEAVWDTVDATDDEVRAMFMRAQTQVTARHLYAPTESGADALRQRLLAGETFESLALEVFKDPLLRDTGGFLGSFTFDEMDSAVEDAAFLLPIGVISEPIRTAQGYSILRVESRFTNPLITESAYAERRPLYEAYTLRREQERARREVLYQELEEIEVALAPAVMDVLVGQIDGSTILDGEALAVLLQQSYATFVQDGEKKTWSVEDFRERAQQVAAHRRSAVQTPADLAEFTQGLIVNEVLVDKARSMHLDRTHSFNDALTDALNSYILKDLRESTSFGAAVHEDSIRAYYDRAPALEFMRSASVYVEVLRENGELAWSGHAAANDLGPWSTRVLDAPQGSIVGPLQAPAGTFLVRVGASRPPGRMSFQEARPRIRSILRYEQTRKRRRQLYDDLRAHHDIQIFESRLATVMG